MKVKRRSHGDEDDKLTIEDVIQLGGDQVRVVLLPVTLISILTAYHRNIVKSRWYRAFSQS